MTSIEADGQSHRIIDIRSDRAGIELKQDIIDGIKGDEKTLPTLLLYDESGLKLFEEITYLDEYYLTNAEIDVLEAHADEIACKIADNAIVLELGSGNLRKIKILLDAFEAAKKKIEYYALDLDRSELQRTLAAVPNYKHVVCFGLHGTYDDGLEWLSREENQSRPKTVLSMGSSIGNFTRDEAAAFLRNFASRLTVNDNLIIGLDACQDAEKVHRAYNDESGVTARFTLNGLRHANELLGEEIFKQSEWYTFGRYNIEGGKHQAFVAPNKDVQIFGVEIGKDEAIRIEESCKYNAAQAKALWQESGLAPTSSWLNKTSDYALHLIHKPIMFSASAETYAAHPVPSIEEWRSLWQVWDTVTLKMIPDAELKSKPIKLRNACIFYLGHIPTFLDMKISQAMNEPPTQPAYFHSIFERGIDPDVDDPSKCHDHSEVPAEYPELPVILDYQQSVRKRVERMYTSGLAYENLWAGRVLWLGLEHEAMHLETLLYMLIQSDKMLPPPGNTRPEFAFEQPVGEAQWHDIPAQSIVLGLDDPDSREGPLRFYGWDVEKPERVAQVKAFKASARPITNFEYAKYMLAEHVETLPASWTTISEQPHEQLDPFFADKAVKTVFGPVALSHALNWPVSASYDELSRCAKYMGGRIPSLEETRSLYTHVDNMKEQALQSLQNRIPAVNGHLVNEGVQETPPSRPTVPISSKARPNASDFFINLEDSNVGFKNWHPTSVRSDQLAGQGEMGGLWEWTSSALEKQKGFAPMELYPAYSADFYDGKHNVVLGGSWATHPRLAGRKSFVNWYQRNYPYVWAGARVVKDV